MSKNENIIESFYAFMVYFMARIEKFPRNQRFLLGDRMQNILLDVLGDFISAYYSPKSEKKAILKGINIELEKLRYLTRLVYEKRYVNTTSYEHINQQLYHIGSQLGAWIKSLDR